jgi:hypothetical protein
LKLGTNQINIDGRDPRFVWTQFFFHADTSQLEDQSLGRKKNQMKLDNLMSKTILKQQQREFLLHNLELLMEVCKQ